MFLRLINKNSILAKSYIFLLFLHLNSVADYEVNDYYRQQFFLSNNLFGQIGIIQVPSALLREEGSISINLIQSKLYNFGSLSVSPFNWLEASYFYYRPSDLWWYGPGSEGKYLDKGFNIKLGKSINSNLGFAIGLDDFAGTGLFSKEYVVITNKYKFSRATIGFGWGEFANKGGFKNPFGIIDERFKNRPAAYTNVRTGGSLNTARWFRGPVSFIGGLEFTIPKMKDAMFKIEYDPYEYMFGFSSFGKGTFAGQNLDLRKRNSNINFGFTKKFMGLELGIYRVKGNLTMLNFSINANFKKPFFKKNINVLPFQDSNKGSSRRLAFYEDLIYNINRQGVFLQTAEIQQNDLKVAVASATYRNPLHVHAIVGETAQATAEQTQTDILSISTIGVNVGHELYKISTPIEYFKDRKKSPVELVLKDSEISSGNKDSYQSFEFRPLINYPASFTGVVPALVNHIGNPQQFYYGGLVLRLDNEIQFSSKLQLNTEIHQNIFNNFDEKANYPNSLLPHVRTDIVSYLQESDTYINRMQLDYFSKLSRNIYGKVSFGILESMYVGSGFELLFKPFEENFSIGFEAYRAKKRAFDRRFDLLDYEINTGHINFNYYFSQLGILGTFSYGKYLAGDEGYTFDVSRRLLSGFRAGMFFTLTNVSKEQFGEGSFDKGFYFQIPIDLFLNDYRGGYINFKLRPLTRDGGQKLEAGNDLIGIMHSTSRAEIERDWSSFND